MEHRDGYYTLTEIARAAGANYQTLHSRMYRGRFPRPTEIVEGRLYYSEQQFTELVQKIKAKAGEE